jgi:hypothetical protein
VLAVVHCKKLFTALGYNARPPHSQCAKKVCTLKDRGRAKKFNRVEVNIETEVELISPQSNAPSSTEGAIEKKVEERGSVSKCLGGRKK